MIAPPRVSLGRLFWKFLVIGAVSFGGGIVAYLQRMLIEDTHWLDAEQFLVTLEISQTLPGLNAVNMSVLVGDRLRGWVGSVVAGTAMVLPGAVFVFCVGVAAAQIHRASPAGHAALAGVAAGAVGLLAAIVVRTGGKQVLKPLPAVLVVLTFVLMSIVKLPMFAILFTLAPISIYLYRPRSGGSHA